MVSTALQVWREALEAHPEEDELGLRIGRVVLANLEADRALSPAVRESLLEETLRAFDVNSSASPEDAAAAYRQACFRSRHQRTGPRASVPGELFVLLNTDEMRVLVRDASQSTTAEEGARAWNVFEEAWRRDDLQTIRGILQSAPLHPKGYQLFASFDPRLADHC